VHSRFDGIRRTVGTYRKGGIVQFARFSAFNMVKDKRDPVKRCQIADAQCESIWMDINPVNSDRVDELVPEMHNSGLSTRFAPIEPAKLMPRSTATRLSSSEAGRKAP